MHFSPECITSGQKNSAKRYEFWLVNENIARPVSANDAAHAGLHLLSNGCCYDDSFTGIQNTTAYDSLSDSRRVVKSHLGENK